MANVNVVTAEDSAVKAKISEVVTAYKGASKEFANVFIGLCERFTNKDSQTGSLLEHLLNQIGDDHKILRGRIVARLSDWSNNTLKIEFLKDKNTWLVQTKKKDGKSTFDKEAFESNVAAAKKSSNALTFSPTGETDEQKKARLEAAKKERYFKSVKAGTAEKEVSEELVTLAKALLEVEKDLTPARLAVKLEAMVKDVLLQVQPAIEGEKA
ncbi:hypothetical protein IGV50_004412 [Salmonella enterica subsp. enterica serovar Newport]|nr:hypothetical protein [Salmonella enterica subsp. enterica serovar Newport]